MKALATFLLAWLVSTAAYCQDGLLADNRFVTADSIAAMYADLPLTDMRALSNKLTSSLTTDEEKFRAIYRWICNNIEVDFALNQANITQRAKLTDPAEREKWNQQLGTKALRGLIKNRKTVCTGYALLLKELAGYAGLEAVVVDGYGRTFLSNIGGTGVPNHSWNAIRVGKSWYLCDPTWSAGAYNPEQSRFVRKFHSGYFMCPPDLFILNHYPLDTAFALLSKKPSLATFLSGPLIYTNAFEYHIQPLQPQSFVVNATKGLSIEFRFIARSAKHLDQVRLHVGTSGKFQEFKSNVMPDGTVEYTTKYSFKSKGVRAVHVLVGGEHVISYEVRVK